MRHLVLALWLAHSASFAADPTQDPCLAEKTRIKACEGVITACSKLVEEQDEAIIRLKAQVSTLQERLADSEPKGVPTWAVITLSVLSGVAAGVVISR